MAYSTITDSFKKTLLNTIMSEFLDSDNTYYIGIGRSEDWNETDTPVEISNTIEDQIDFRKKLQSIKQVENLSYVVPRVTWSANTIYSAYDDSVAGHPAQSFYVLTTDNNVYICLKAGKNSAGETVVSVVKPSSKNPEPFTLSDGYIWKYLYTLDNSSIAKYLSNNFMPVKLMDSDYVLGDYSSEDSDQYANQLAAVGGQITSIDITNAGSGYTSVPSVTVVGDGTVPASYSATILNGQVVSIDVDSDGLGNLLMGEGYTSAIVVISGGGATSTATARAIISSEAGFGANPIDDLRSRALMFNSQLTGAEDGSFLVNQDFRQVGLIRNPKIAGSDSDYTLPNGSALNFISYQPGDITGTFVPDQKIEGLSSGAVAYIDSFNETAYKLYYHQNDDTGYLSFDSDETIQQVGSPEISTVVDVINKGDINPLSGDVLYIENRASVDRSSEQTEDIKIIIQI